MACRVSLPRSAPCRSYGDACIFCQEGRGQGIVRLLDACTPSGWRPWRSAILPLRRHLKRDACAQAHTILCGLCGRCRRSWRKTEPIRVLHVFGAPSIPAVCPICDERASAARPDAGAVRFCHDIRKTGLFDLYRFRLRAADLYFDPARSLLDNLQYVPRKRMACLRWCTAMCFSIPIRAARSKARRCSGTHRACAIHTGESRAVCD